MENRSFAKIGNKYRALAFAAAASSFCGWASSALAQSENIQNQQLQVEGCTTAALAEFMPEHPEGKTADNFNPEVGDAAIRYEDNEMTVVAGARADAVNVRMTDHNGSDNDVKISLLITRDAANSILSDRWVYSWDGEADSLKPRAYKFVRSFENCLGLGSPNRPLPNPAPAPPPPPSSAPSSGP